MMKNLMIQMMLKKVFALFGQTKLIWLAVLMVGTTAHAGVTVRYQHTDSLGSVIMETNASGQMIGSRHQYQPFGQGLNGQKTGLGYTGHLEDTDLGLTYMQQRYYDPVIGRFYSNDPVGFYSESPMSFNRYLYVDNNPYKYIDPTGQVKIEVKLEAVAVLVAGAKVSTGIYFDTKTLELGGTISGGGRLGFEGGVALSFGIAESSTSPATQGLSDGGNFDASLSIGLVGAGREFHKDDGSLNGVANGWSGALSKSNDVFKLGLLVGGSVGGNFTGKASTDKVEKLNNLYDKALRHAGQMNQSKYRGEAAMSNTMRRVMGVKN